MISSLGGDILPIGFFQGTWLDIYTRREICVNGYYGRKDHCTLLLLVVSSLDHSPTFGKPYVFASILVLLGDKMYLRSYVLKSLVG